MKNEKLKEQFTQRLVNQVFSQYITGADIELACQRLIAKSDPERKRILENCLNLFRDADTQQKIEELQKTEQPENTTEFVQLLLVRFAERIFEHDKRQYDMSSKYTGKRIQEIKKHDGTIGKNISFENSPDDELNFVLQDDDGNMIVFERIGKLKCVTESPNNTKTVTKLNIKFSASNGYERNYTVFTNINFNKLTDKAYLRAVLDELLSKKNIEHSNCGGYIGEIRPCIGGIDEIKIGEQVNSSELYLDSCTRYRFSKKYELIYDFDTLEAVVDYTLEQENEKQQQKQKEKQDPPKWLKDYVDER